MIWFSQTGPEFFHSRRPEQDSDHEDYDRFGEEDGISRFEGEVKLTPFNMKEELEEGRFDKDGHYLFNKNKDATDNWLDNIDWVRVKDGAEPAKPIKETKTLGDSDSEDSNDDEASGRFDEAAKYKEILAMMQPKETVKKALQRLGVRISSAERWKRKKLGIVDDSSEKVTKLTELANEILTHSGNMSVYEETYEVIEKKIKNAAGLSSAADFDMFGDEPEKMDQGTSQEAEGKEKEEADAGEDKLMWEFKWKQEDENIQGPCTTEQMQNWVEEGYFKEGVFVRKCGAEDAKFYTSNRIDFDLYL